ncbi:hypothetical protein EYF80_005096 [Liparis tanakae]|uniref:Uncharacterized protein n=1 Tax=Liparis tanakae TaxID=230148 RepID=A0A4Z2J422_9TELE|nr:hypothetical protein EYF80_005096 [Liparis tanakae]
MALCEATTAAPQMEDATERGLEKFSNAFDFLECKHNLRLPCKEGPLFCYSEPWPLIVAAGTKGEEKASDFLTFEGSENQWWLGRLSPGAREAAPRSVLCRTLAPTDKCGKGACGSPHQSSNLTHNAKAGTSGAFRVGTKDLNCHFATARPKVANCDSSVHRGGLAIGDTGVGRRGWAGPPPSPTGPPSGIASLDYILRFTSAAAFKCAPAMRTLPYILPRRPAAPPASVALQSAPGSFGPRGHSFGPSDAFHGFH